MTSGRGTKWAEVVDVRWEQEHVRKILASAAALKGETIQSEWNEDDYDFSDDRWQRRWKRSGLSTGTGLDDRRRWHGHTLC
jgi:hypothetical protein